MGEGGGDGDGDGSPVQSDFPKPRRSRAMQRKEWCSQRGSIRDSNLREDMGQPWRKIRVGLGAVVAVRRAGHRRRGCGDEGLEEVGGGRGWR